jgi:hypothetical protein
MPGWTLHTLPKELSMRITTPVAALGILVAMAACTGGLTTPSGSCSGAPVVRANGAVFAASGPASADEAGALFAVVARERACESPPVTVADSAPPRPREPWVDGDGYMLKAGTRLYERVGSKPGQELVAERAPGEWVRLMREGIE